MKNKYSKLLAWLLPAFFTIISIPFASAAAPTFSTSTNCDINPIAYNGTYNYNLLVNQPVVYCSSSTYYMLRIVPTSYTNDFASNDYTVKLYHTGQLIITQNYPKLNYDLVINTGNTDPMSYVTGVEVSYKGIIVATLGSVPSCGDTVACNNEVNNSTNPDPGCNVLDFSQTCQAAPVGALDSCEGFNILSPTSWVRCLFIPSPGQVNLLITTFHNNLTNSFVGDGLSIIDFIISPIIEWKDAPVQCEGVIVDLTFGDTEGSFLPSTYIGKIPHYYGTPFSTCNTEAMAYVSGWILAIQKFIFSFGGILLTSHILFSAFGMSVSVFSFWRKTK